jgi:hypothetical protein
MAPSNTTTALAGLVTVLVLAALSPAMADAQDLRCSIPFSFVVNARIMPPGTYLVSDVGQGVLYVRDFNHGAFASNMPVSDREGTSPRLVFHRYGDQYVLRQVFTTATEGRELPEPRFERELERVSLNGAPMAKRVTVVLAAD